MNKRVVVVGLVSVLLAGVVLAGNDWPQWRGPNRDCIAAKSPPLTTSWALTSGPACVWTSERIPSGNDGGYGSVSVADDRVYLLCTPKYQEAIPTRKMGGDWGGRLGYSKERLPAELNAKVEAARVSEDRAKLKGGELNKYIDKFIADNVSPAPTTTPVTTADKDYANKRNWQVNMVRDRINRGAGAIDWAILDKVLGIKDKQFATEQELNAWLDENNIKDEARKAIVSVFPTKVNLAKDTIWCLSAADGKKVWAKEYQGADRTYGNSSTPTVADGKVYVVGADSVVYCLDAKTGEEVWKNKPAGGERSSSVLVGDGKAIVLCDQLTCYDAAKGTILWQQPKIRAVHQSPQWWVSGGKTYVIVNTDGAVFCVDPKDGSVLWQAPSGALGIPAIAGDQMVIWKGDGLLGYKITPEKAEKLWVVPASGDRGCSPTIVDGHAYVFHAGNATCVDLATGKPAWQAKFNACEFSAAVAVDGKLIGVGGGKGLTMIRATPEKLDIIAKTNMAVTDCTTPAIVNGRMYVRLPNGVGCFDLTTPTTEPAKKK